MNYDGWIPREQILGDVARSKVDPVNMSLFCIINFHYILSFQSLLNWRVKTAQ